MGAILREELGIPSMTFEANMVDPRGYDDAQVKSSIQAFMEMLEAKKYPQEVKVRQTIKGGNIVDFNLTEQQQMFKNSVKKFTEQSLPLWWI